MPTDRVVQMIAADGTPYVGVEWAGDRTMPLRDRSDIEKCNKSRAETAMGASSKKDAKETEAETEPPGTPAKEEKGPHHQSNNQHQWTDPLLGCKYPGPRMGGSAFGRSTTQWINSPCTRAASARRLGSRT